MTRPMYQCWYFQFPGEHAGGSPRELGGKAEWEVARATEFPWVLEKGGFLPFPLTSHLSFQKALTSPPLFLGFSRVPALKRGTSKPKGPGPSCGPLHGYLGSGDLQSPPASPTIAPDVAAGEGWVQGPAGSGHLVVLLLQSQHILCQLARPPHSAFPRPNF